MKPVTAAIAVLGIAFAVVPTAHAADSGTSFFVTSAGPGDGANLGGIAGADAQCQKLAEAAGIAGKTWHAYLSDSTANAKDRIGAGPWQNAKGVVIATSVADLHSDSNKLTKESAITEKGDVVNGRGDKPNRHDMLTGTNPDGTANANTCGDWKLNGAGSAMVGHSDRMGLKDDAPSKSWNSSHPSKGCSQADLQGTGGDGLFYCFATN